MCGSLISSIFGGNRSQPAPPPVPAPPTTPPPPLPIQSAPTPVSYTHLTLPTSDLV